MDPVFFINPLPFVAGLILLGTVVLFVIRAVRPKTTARSARPGAALASLRPTRCRWQKGEQTEGRTLQPYTCATCGFETYSGDGTPPRGCKRAFKPAPL